MLPTSTDSFPHLIKKRRSQLGFVTYLLTYSRMKYRKPNECWIAVWTVWICTSYFVFYQQIGVWNVFFGPSDERNIITPDVVHGCGTWPPMLTDEQSWRYSRMERWGRYFDLTRRKWQEDGKIRLLEIFMILAPDQMLFVFITRRRKGGAKLLTQTGGNEIHKKFWLGNLKETDH